MTRGSRVGSLSPIRKMRQADGMDGRRLRVDEQTRNAYLSGCNGRAGWRWAGWLAGCVGSKLPAFPRAVSQSVRLVDRSSSSHVRDLSGRNTANRLFPSKGIKIPLTKGQHQHEVRNSPVGSHEASLGNAKWSR